MAIELKAHVNDIISKIAIAGKNYDLHDAVAAANIETLKTIVDGLVVGGITYQVVDELPEASEDTLGGIYLKPLEEGVGTEGDYYDEHITVKKEDPENPGEYIYEWEKIGSTEVNMEDYAKKGDYDVSVEGTAAKAETGIAVADHVVTNGDVTLTGSYTPVGSITVAEATADKVANYIPNGQNAASAVTFDVASTQNVYSMATSGSVDTGKAAKFTQGVDTFTQGTLADWGASVSGETLSFSWTAPTASTFTQGTDAFTANVPTSVTLPTRSSAIKAVTASTTATAAAQNFTGVGAVLGFAGDTSVNNISVSGKTNVSISAHDVTDNGHTHIVTADGTVTL